MLSKRNMASLIVFGLLLTLAFANANSYCDTNTSVSFGQIFSENNQLYLDWRHFCIDECDCTHFRISVFSCNISEPLCQFNLSISCNAIRLPYYSFDDDTQIHIEICSSTQCYVPSCKGDILRLDKTLLEIRNVEVEQNQSHCFNFSFHRNGIELEDLFINGEPHTITGSDISVTNNAIDYIIMNNQLVLCILNTTEVFDEFGTIITLQESYIDFNSCTDMISSNCNVQYRGVPYRVYCFNVTPDSIISTGVCEEVASCNAVSVSSSNLFSTIDSGTLSALYTAVDTAVDSAMISSYTAAVSMTSMLITSVLIPSTEMMPLPTQSPTENDDNNGLHPGVIAAIVSVAVLILVGVLVTIAIIVFNVRKYRDCKCIRPKKKCYEPENEMTSL